MIFIKHEQLIINITTTNIATTTIRSLSLSLSFARPVNCLAIVCVCVCFALTLGCANKNHILFPTHIFLRNSNFIEYNIIVYTRKNDLYPPIIRRVKCSFIPRNKKYQVSFWYACEDVRQCEDTDTDKEIDVIFVKDDDCIQRRSYQAQPYMS
jgi:hypothetical protein